MVGVLGFPQEIFGFGEGLERVASGLAAKARLEHGRSNKDFTPTSSLFSTLTFTFFSQVLGSHLCCPWWWWWWGG